jgi:hypothetical protein
MIRFGGRIGRNYMLFEDSNVKSEYLRRDNPIRGPFDFSAKSAGTLPAKSTDCYILPLCELKTVHACSQRKQMRDAQYG